MKQPQHDCKDELRRVDLKATPVRLAVMELLEKSATPIDATSIMDYLRKRDIDADPATVFRSMNSFVDKGLVKQIQFAENKQRYELASKPEHHHLICTQCHSVEDISDCNIEGLEKEIAKKKHFAVQWHSLEFFGLCKNCRTA